MPNATCLNGTVTDDGVEDRPSQIASDLILPVIYLVIYIIDSTVSEARDRLFLDAIESSELSHLRTDATFTTGYFFSTRHACGVLALNILEGIVSAIQLFFIAKPLQPVGLAIWSLAAIESVSSIFSEALRIFLFASSDSCWCVNTNQKL